MAKERLFIIDAMALAFRSFYALGRSSLATSQGMPTGAIYGSAMFLNKLIQEQRPHYLVAVTDTPEPTFRHEIYKEYKATRDRMPDDLGQQIPLIFELFSHFHMPLLRLPGMEADDVIGTLAKRYAGPNLDAYIVSGDKDFMQIIGDHIFMYAPKKNEEALIIDVAGVKEKFGCTPAQVVDCLALIGDTVDNVPGVQGIGEKGAAQLIQTYGSLEGIYANLDKITAKKQREGLERCKDDAFLSRRLVTLATELHLPLKLPDLVCSPDLASNNAKLAAFYNRFEFKTLANKVLKTLEKSEGKAKAKIDSAPAVDGAKIELATGVLVDDAATQASLKAALDQSKTFAFVMEGFGFGSDVIADKPSLLGLATEDGSAFALPLTEEGVYFIRPYLTKPEKKKIGHSLKTSWQGLYNVGIDLGPNLVDLEVADYLIDPNNYNHTTEALVGRFNPNLPVAGDAASRALTLLRLADAILPRIANMGLTAVFEEIEMPLIPVLAEMERTGIYVDAEFLDKYSNELADIGNKVEANLYQAAGQEFNINSPKQLQELLFEKLKLQDEAGIKRMKKTKTGFSTDESVLLRLAASHAVPQLILDYRAVSKLKNTYVDSLPQFINPKSGRIHTSFRQTVAATGRLSSDKPNLQNIPMRSDLGRKIRRAFTPGREGEVIISADYSQVEIRLLAHLAGDESLIDAFKRGLDIHTVTAAKIFGVKESAVDQVLRSRAKAVNFGIIYGMGPQRLAQETGVTLAEAKEFIQRYFEVYPGIYRLTETLVESAREKGYCVTMKGRRRPIPEIGDTNQGQMARGENIAINAPIQGSAADLIKLAMIRIQADFRRNKMKTRMLLQVHDELVFSAPLSEVEKATALIRQGMEHAFETKVPLKVDIRSGKDWLDAHG